MRSSLLIIPLSLVGCTDATMAPANNMPTHSSQTLLGAAAIEAVLPSAYSSIMGESGNNFPHSARNLRYQQVFSGSDVVDPTVVGLCLRRDDLFGGSERTQTLRVLLGPTSLDFTNLGGNFSANYSAAPTEVFAGDVVIPASTGNGTPADFDFCIPFTQSYTHPAGSNIIVEVVNTSLVSGNVARDACSGTAATCTTARAFAFSSTGETAALVQSGGVIMKFLSPEPPPPVNPASKDECRQGRWSDFGFRNQGQCIRFIETGLDSRESPPQS